MNVAYSNVEMSMSLFSEIPLRVLDDVPVATVDLLPPTSTLPPDSPDCVARYAQYLKYRYKRMSILPDGDWPPSLGGQYTRLAMIERERELPGAELVAPMERDYIHGNIDNIVKRKKAIQLPEVFLPPEDGGQQLKILMDGAPGVGKSTLSRKVCKDWASGELLQQYHLVILLPLRQPSIREATSIEGLIEADDPDLKHQVVRHIQRTSGEHVLLIVDGYDELSYDDRTKNSLFLCLIQEKKFPKCSVLVTSRPYASDYLQQLESVNRHVEVLGFTEEQIKHCIMENIPDKTKATELVQTLKERQDIVSLCYIPLNCAIVLYVYKMAQWTLPNTLTKLYEIFHLNAMKRCASIVGNESIIMRQCTQAEIPELFQKHLNALSKLAYDSLVVEKLVFSVKDIKAAFPDGSDLNKDINLFGLITVFKEFTSTGEELSYQFLHLTIQEFLAARWAASQLSPDELLKFFQDHLREERYRMVLLFLAGISQLRFPCAQHIFRDELDFKPSGLMEYSNRKVVEYFLLLCHLINESQNFSLYQILAGTIVGAELFVASYLIAPFDCLVLAHFLAWCDCSLKLLNLSNCGLTSESLEIMHRVNLEHHGTTQIEEVDFNNHLNIITKLSLLSKLPMFEHTKVLKVCSLLWQYHEGASYVVDLFCLMNMRYLTTLEISVKTLFPPLDKIYLSLDKFRFQNGNIDSQNAVGIFRSLEHNTSLEKLDLLGNRQLAEGDSEAVGCAIERMLNVNRTLKVLNLSSCELDTAIATNIFRSLEHNTSLEELDLSENWQLAEGDSEAVGCAIEWMLNVNRTLKVLNLSSCELDTALATNVFRSLEHNTSLEELDLSENWRLPEGDSEAVGCAIERMLNVNRTLKVLNLSSCELDTAVTTSIFRSLEHNTSLEVLHLSENSQLAEGDSEAVGCAIERMLKVNRALKVLNLQGCRITDPIAKHILTGLINSTSLVTLDIEPCTLGVGCAVSLLTHPTVRNIVDEVNILGVGRMKSDKGTIMCENSLGPVFYFSSDRLRCQSGNIDSQNAVDIFRSLEHNAILRELDLSGNSQLAEGDSEALGCAIESMLNVNKTLKSLNLSGCAVTNPIVKHILTGLANNTSLVTFDMGSLTLSGSCAVSLLQQITTHPTVSITVGEVNVLGVGRVKMDIGSMWCDIGDLIAENCVEFFRALNNSDLKVSKLNVQHLTDQTAEHFAVGLAECQLVQALKLQHCYISSTGAVSIFRSLEHNTSLEELDLSGNRQLAEGDSEAVGCVIESMLNVNRTLKSFNLSGCQVTDPIVKHILIGLTKNTSLVTLNMKSPKLSVSCAVSLFQQMTTHPSLSITVGEVTVLGVGRVEMDRGSMWCDIGDLIAENCVEFFRALNNSDLKVSNLNVQDLTDQTAEHFAVGLAECQLVQALKLQHCYISSTGAVSIFRSLEHNTSLEELDLSGNRQLAEGDSEAVGCVIESMLNVNRTLKSFNLSGCQVTDPIVKHILIGLTKNTSLVTLNMRSPKLSVSCAVSLFQQMTTHPSLSITVGEVTVLGVGRVEMDRGSLQCVVGDTIPKSCVEFFRALNNSGLSVPKLNVQHLTDQTAEQFAVGLAESQSVLAMKLEHCNITSAGAVSIFRSLEHNTSLEELDLSENWRLAEGDSEAAGCAIERMLNVNRTMKILNLTNCRLTNKVASYFANGLAQNHSVRKVILHSNNIRSTGTVSIFRSLEHNTSLEELDLSGNSHLAESDSEAVGCAIERMLNVNRTMKILNLTNCRLTNEVASYFANGLAQNHSVRKVILHSNNIRSTGAVSIFRSLEHNTSLEELDLSENWRLAEGDSEAVGCAIERMLNVNRTLKVLNLSDCNATDPIVNHILTGLTKNTSLVTLDMRSPKLSGSCAVSLFQQMATHPILIITVGEVDVLGVGRVEMDRGSMQCVIGDLIPENCVEFFRALNNSGLKISKLNVQHLTDQTAEHFAVPLAESQSVQALKLRQCSITSTGAVSILRSLEHNSSLEGLDLSGNSQLAEGDSEALDCTIERMLNVNRTLKVLNLCNCEIDTTVISHIAAGLAHNASLAELNIRGGYFRRINITSEGWVHLFKALCNNTSLKKLDISGNKLGMEGSVAQAKMLSCNKSLTELYLRLCNIPEAGLREIARGLLQNTSLKKLDISGNKPGMEGSVALAGMLSCNKPLTELNLRSCDIPEGGLREIARGLLQNTSLKKLDISENNLGMEGSVALAEMLSCNKSLTELNLWSCDIPQAGLREIARGLLQNTSLKKLDISGNKLGMEGSVAQAEMLSCNKSLTELYLRLCSIPEAGLREIARGLLQNTSLKKLDISGNKPGMEGSVALAGMLSCNKSLTELNLRSCDIPEGGLREIARGLLQNTSLKKLDISENNLGMEGSVALAEMLSCNKSLTELNLRSCDIPEAGLREIARGLLQNTSLKKLDISNHKPGMEGSVALAEMLSCNKSLTELNLVWFDIPEGGLREIARGLFQNTTLQTLTLWSTEHKTILKAEIERLKKSGNFTPQSLSRLEIKSFL